MDNFTQVTGLQSQSAWLSDLGTHLHTHRPRVVRKHSHIHIHSSRTWLPISCQFYFALCFMMKVVIQFYIPFCLNQKHVFSDNFFGGTYVLMSNRLVQEGRSSIANALELHPSRTNPLISNMFCLVSELWYSACIRAPKRRQKALIHSEHVISQFKFVYLQLICGFVASLSH